MVERMLSMHEAAGSMPAYSIFYTNEKYVIFLKKNYD